MIILYEGGQQKKNIEKYKRSVLDYCMEAKTSVQIKDMLKIKPRQYVSSNIIAPLIKEGKLEYTNKNSVNAKNQKYVTVKKQKE